MPSASNLTLCVKEEEKSKVRLVLAREDAVEVKDKDKVDADRLVQPAEEEEVRQVQAVADVVRLVADKADKEIPLVPIPNRFSGN